MPLQRLLSWHFWLAILVSLPLIVLALSGAGLAFSDEIDRALNPDLRNVPPEYKQPALPLSHFLSLRTSHIFSQKSSESPVLTAVFLPQTPYDSLRIDWLVPASTETNPPYQTIETYFNPNTGRFLGQRWHQNTLYAWLAHIHRQLFLADTGTLIIKSALPLVLAVLFTGGGILWRLRPPQQTLPQPKTLHEKMGLYAFPILMTLVATALISVFFNAFQFNDSHRKFTPPTFQGSLPAYHQSFEQLYPQLTQSSNLCQAPQQLYQIRLHANTTADIYCQTSQDSGSLTQTHWRLTTQRPPQHIPQMLSNISWAFHTGEWLSLPGRILWMWASLAFLYLIYSGLTNKLRRIPQ